MGKLTGYSMGLIALLGGATRDAGAATLSEMRMINASQKPGMVDPETIELSFPYARGLEEIFLTGMKGSTVSYGEYSTYRVTSATDFQILPGLDSPDAPVMYCTVRSGTR